jgi:tetratricopeptide (TPR) repeat protein
LWRRAENFEEAKRAFETAMAKDPNNPQHRFKLEDLEIWKMSAQLAKLEEGGKAREGAGRAEYLEKKRKTLEFKMHSFLDRERLYSTDGRIRFELANIFFELAEEMGEDGMYDEAIKRFQIVFPDPKFRNEAGLKMGTGFARKGQFDLALKRFDETLAKAGELKDLNWKTLMYAKADTLEKAGKKNEAKEIFLAIYEVDVSFKDVSNRVQNLS